MIKHKPRVISLTAERAAEVILYLKGGSHPGDFPAIAAALIVVLEGSRKNLVTFYAPLIREALREHQVWFTEEEGQSGHKEMEFLPADRDILLKELKRHLA